MPTNADIQIRDPFVVPVPEEGVYYLFGTTNKDPWRGGEGFDCYRGRDLENWDGPFPAFRPPPGFWSDREFWAPEVHRFGGRWFMFASFKMPQVCRGTQILVADRPEGPYRPHRDGPVTPRDWECLDGTLHVAPDGTPWLVFCHEWVQIGDGGMCALRLTPDLKAAAGDPVTLFHASAAPWAARFENRDVGQLGYGIVTDGPFLFRAQDGALLMLWSSLGKDGYAMGVARAASGQVTGPWEQQAEPVFAKDGGHGMLFRTFDGGLRMTLHCPNRTPDERPVFLPVEETGTTLRRV